MDAALKVLNEARRGLFLQFFSHEDVDTTSLRRAWQSVRSALLEAKRNGATLPQWVRAALRLWHWKEARSILLEYIEDEDYQALDRFLQQQNSARAQAVSDTMFKFYNKSRLIAKRDAAASPVEAAQVDVAIKHKEVQEKQEEVQQAEQEAAPIITETAETIAKTITLDDYITGVCGKGKLEKRRISDNNYVCKQGQTCDKKWCKTEKSGSKYGITTGYWDVCNNPAEYTTCEKDEDTIFVKDNTTYETVPHKEQLAAKGVTSENLTKITDQIAILLNQKESTQSHFSNVDNPEDVRDEHTKTMAEIGEKLTKLKKQQSELLQSTENALDAVLARIQAAVLIWEKRKALYKTELQNTANVAEKKKYASGITQSDTNIKLLETKLTKYANLSESLQNPESIFCAGEPEERFVSTNNHICIKEATCLPGSGGDKWCRTEDGKGKRSILGSWDACDASQGQKRVCKKFNKNDELEYAEIPLTETLKSRYMRTFGLEDPKDK